MLDSERRNEYIDFINICFFLSVVNVTFCDKNICLILKNKVVFVREFDLVDTLNGKKLKMLYFFYN